VAFVVVYFVLFAAGVFFILRLMNALPHGPDEELLVTAPLRTPLRASAAAALAGAP
jgi:cytochrome d ubiquinol oxidase subunit I